MTDHKLTDAELDVIDGEARPSPSLEWVHVDVKSKDWRRLLDQAHEANRLPGAPIPMRIHCPECRVLHIDAGEFATKPHHTHACQRCGNVWRPALVPTVGVRFLPGFKDAS